MADSARLDPQAVAARILSEGGLESLRGLIAGRHPPPSITKTMGFTLHEVEAGRAVFVGEPSDAVLNPFGVVHGGWALTLIDSAAGCAAHTTLSPGEGLTTVETKVNFVRAITPATGPVRAEGRVIARGRTIITTDATVVDSAGKLLAHGTSTVMVLRQERNPS